MTKKERLKQEHERRLESFIRRNRVRQEDGRLVLYKAVRTDLGSWYTRHSRHQKKGWSGVYKPGARVSCRRFNRDPGECCGSGLHVSTRGFAQDFAQIDAPIVIRVLVDPEDVVCVPYGLPRKIRVKRLYVDRIVRGKRWCTCDLSG